MQVSSSRLLGLAQPFALGAVALGQDADDPAARRLGDQLDGPRRGGAQHLPHLQTAVGADDDFLAARDRRRSRGRTRPGNAWRRAARSKGTPFKESPPSSGERVYPPPILKHGGRKGRGFFEWVKAELRSRIPSHSPRLAGGEVVPPASRGLYDSSSWPPRSTSDFNSS